MAVGVSPTETLSFRPWSCRRRPCAQKAQRGRLSWNKETHVGITLSSNGYPEPCRPHHAGCHGMFQLSRRILCLDNSKHVSLLFVPGPSGNRERVWSSELVLRGGGGGQAPAEETGGRWAAPLTRPCSTALGPASPVRRRLLQAVARDGLRAWGSAGQTDLFSLPGR